MEMTVKTKKKLKRQILRRKKRTKVIQVAVKMNLMKKMMEEQIVLQTILIMEKGLGMTKRKLWMKEAFTEVSSVNNHKQLKPCRVTMVED